MSKPTDSASVIECLRELWPDFHLTIENQMNPTSDIAIMFYEKFICSQLQIEIGKLQQLLVDQSSCPEAFMDIINIYVLYSCTDTVIKKLGLTQLSFKLSDLLVPTRKKFRMSLILLSNCVIYTAGIQELMEEMKQKVFEKMQQVTDMRHKVEEQKEKINNNVMLHVEDTKKINELKKRNAEQVKQLENENLNLAQVKKDVQEVNAEYLQAQDEREKLLLKLNDLQLIEEKLKSEIVDDHEAIVSENARLTKIRDELLRESESDKWNKMMKQKMQNIAGYQENLQYVEEFMKTVPLTKLQENYELLDQLNNEIHHMDNEIKLIQKHDTIDALKEMQQVNESIKQKLDALVNNHDEKMKNFDIEKIKLQNELKQEQNHIDDKLEKIQTLDENLLQIGETTKKYEQLTENEITCYNQKYKTILDLKAHLDNKVTDIIDKVGSQMYNK